MNVLVVEPGYLPYEKEIDDLPDMKKLVGGPIQAIYPFREPVALVCNEEAHYQRAEFNRAIPERSYGGIFGTFFVCGLGEESFISLTPEQMNTYRERFRNAEILVTTIGHTPVVLEVAPKVKRRPGGAKGPPKPRTR